MNKINDNLKALEDNLNIPKKELSDNFKLQDYKDDFTTLHTMILKNIYKPTKIEFREDKVYINYGNILVEYKYERDLATGKIIKIYNVTEDRIINVIHN